MAETENIEKQGNFTREVAYRVFAAELKNSNLQIKEGEGTYASNYLITPTGAKVNRVFIVGVLVEKEDKGTDTEFWQARIVDPTGVFFVSAGTYQPEAAQMLAKLNAPEFVAVVGKVSVYETQESNKLVSIKAESITVVDAQTRDKWINETVKLTEKRLAEYSSISENIKQHYVEGREPYQEMINLVKKGGD